MPQLRQLVASFSPQWSRFAHKAVHVESVVDKVALGEVFLRVLQFSPDNIIPLLLHTHSCLIPSQQQHVTCTVTKVNQAVILHPFHAKLFIRKMLFCFIFPWKETI
jgi:hypothetical protein